MKEPKLRFKSDDGNQYPKWEEKRLEEVAVRITRKNKDNHTDIPLTISSLDGLIDQRDFFNKIVASKDLSGYYLLKRGEFAYNKSYSKGFDFGSIKRLNLYDEGALSTLYICFALNDNEDSDFYQKYFDSLSWYPELQKICAEGARNHGLLNVSTNDFFQLKLHVPTSKEEQQKIASLFTELDNLIQSAQKELDGYRELKQGMLQKMFPKMGEKVPEIRFPEFTGDWEQRRLGELFNFRYGNGNKNPSNGGKYPVFGAGGVQGGYTKYNAENSVIIGHMGDAGCVSWGEGKHFVTYNGTITKPKDEIFSSKFGYYLLLNMNLRKYRGGSSLPFLTYDMLNEMETKFPSSKIETQRIADYFTNLDNLIAFQQRELDGYKELKKGLFQQMFC